MKVEPDFRCGGIVTPNTSDEELRKRGFTEEGVREIRSFLAYLVAKKEGYDGDFETWRRSQDAAEEGTDDRL